MKGFEALSKGSQTDGKFPLFSAEAIRSEFGLTESAVCHWLCRVESMSTVPLVHYHHDDVDEQNEREEPPRLAPDAIGHRSKEGQVGDDANIVNTELM